MAHFNRPLVRRSSLVVFALFTAATTSVAAEDEGAPIPDDAAVFQRVLDGELAVVGGLTSSRVAERATATSFELRARRADLLKAAADVDRALSAYVPHTSLSARYARLSPLPTAQLGNVVAAPGQEAGPLAPGTQLVNVPLTVPVLVNQYSFQAGLSVPVSDYFLRVGNSVTSARQAEHAVKYQEAASKRQVATEARLAYYSWLSARLETLVAIQALSQSEAHLVDTKHAEAAGSATLADTLAVQAQVAASRVLVDKSQSLTRIAEERMLTVMHEPRHGELRIGEDIRTDVPPLVSSNLNTLFRRAAIARPELAAAGARVSALKANVRVERAGTLPRLDAFANAEYSNPNSRVFPPKDEFRATWQLGGVLSWTISDIPGYAAATRGADAEVAAAVADLHSLEDSIRVEISDALEGTLQADASIASTEERLAAAAEGYRVRRALFQSGRATSVELTDAETELTRARIDALNARVNQRVTRVRLAHASGS